VKNYCTLCHRLHDSSHWKFSTYQNINGTQEGWFCSKWYTISPSKEAVPERIKEDRKKNFKSLLQPYRNGEVSREFVEAYGDKHLDKQEAKKSKYVWKDLPGWSNRNKSM